MNLSEADTRAKLIDPALHRRGWTEDLIRREETDKGIDENLQSTVSNLQSAIDTLPQAVLRKAFRGEL